MSAHCHGRPARSALERNVNVLSVATRLKPRSQKERCSFPEQNGPACLLTVPADSFSSRPPAGSTQLVKPATTIFHPLLAKRAVFQQRIESIRLPDRYISARSVCQVGFLNASIPVAATVLTQRIPAPRHTREAPPNAAVAALRPASRGAAECRASRLFIQPSFLASRL